MNYIFEIIEAELLFIFIIHFFTDYKITFRFYVSLFIGCFVVLISSTYIKNGWVNILLPLISQFLPTVIGIEKIRFKKLLYINIICTSFVSLIYSFILFVSSSIKREVSNNRLIEHCICLFAIFAIILLLKNKKISNLIFEIAAMSKKIKIIVLVFIWELLTIILGLSSLFSLDLSISFKMTISLVLLVTIMVSFIIVFLLISENLNNSYYSKYNKMMEEKLTNDAKHIEKITLATEDLRRLKHDAKNMILGINAYLDSDDIEGARKYLESFNVRIEPTSNWIHTGNPFLDSLISDKYDRLIKNKIHIKFDGLMPTESLKPVDICIVFGNALDNAIEACEKLPINIIKNIEISIKQQANVLFASISNPVSHPVKIHNNTIVSTKNSSGHGIGINSMGKIVNDYNGQLVLKCDETKFTVEMSFVLEFAKIPITQ